MTRDEAIKVLLSKPAIAPSNSERQKKLNEAIDMAIESLQTENEWIPCSERLPIAEREGQVRGFYLTTNERGQVSVKAFEFTDGYVEYGWNSDFEILAWMPLPKPYGERREP
ncbi:MAG: DUF551 domain-containing protein [Clostridiales bacterium]|nr:DUF551 domain-containing protein [Clostridiales bacterium]